MGEAFGSLATSYNFGTGLRRAPMLVDLVLDELAARPSPTRVLDVGCGTGIGQGDDRVDLLRRVRSACDELWGVEPAAAAPPAHGLHTRHLVGTLDAAELPAEHFDVAFAYMVAEHVEDPSAFLRAACRTLKPGGTVLLCTINARHYFGRCVHLAHALAIDERLLPLVTRRDPQAYHHAVRYRMNKPDGLARLAVAAGFASPRFAFVENRGPVAYFRGPLRPMLWGMNLKRRLLRQPDALLSMFVRLEKPRPEGSVPCAA